MSSTCSTQHRVRVPVPDPGPLELVPLVVLDAVIACTTSTLKDGYTGYHGIRMLEHNVIRSGSETCYVLVGVHYRYSRMYCYVYYLHAS